MQNVDTEYRQAIRSTDRPLDEVYGTITFSDGTTLQVTPSIIPSNSISLSRQCIDGDELEFGGVFMGSLDMSIRTDKSRYAFNDARIVLFYRILANNTWKVVKLGEFTVSNPDKVDKNTVKFSADDDMRKLDKPLQSDAMSGTAWDILSLISDITDYPLSFTESDLSQFINVNNNIYIDSTSGIRTYRDALKVVCQSLGCFARDNRNGQLELCKFGTEVVRELNTGDWYRIVPADYICSFVGLTVTSAKGTYVSMYSSEEVGNVMEIKDAPAWDYGSEAFLQQKTDRLFNLLRQIVYTPCEIDTFGDPSYDCGDRLKLITSSGDEIETIITSYEWKWHSGMTIESKGANPYESGVSTSDIASTRLLGKEAASSKFNYYTYLNSREISLTTTFQRIVDIRFTVGSTTTVTLWHEFKWLNTLLNENQEITLNYYLDGIKFDYEPVQTYGENGTHTWGTQFWLQELEAGEAHEWEVQAKLNSGSCVISRGDLHALIQGQNLAPQDEFDGAINIEDTYVPIKLHRTIMPIVEDVLVFTDEPLIITLSDAMPVIKSHRTIMPITDTMRLTAQAVEYTRTTEDGEDTRTTEDGGIRVTEV